MKRESTECGACSSGRETQPEEGAREEGRKRREKRRRTKETMTKMKGVAFSWDKKIESRLVTPLALHSVFRPIGCNVLLIFTNLSTAIYINFEF